MSFCLPSYRNKQKSSSVTSYSLLTDSTSTKMLWDILKQMRCESSSSYAGRQASSGSFLMWHTHMWLNCSSERLESTVSVGSLEPAHTSEGTSWHFENLHGILWFTAFESWYPRNFKILYRVPRNIQTWFLLVFKQLYIHCWLWHTSSCLQESSDSPVSCLGSGRNIIMLSSTIGALLACIPQC